MPGYFKFSETSDIDHHDQPLTPKMDDDCRATPMEPPSVLIWCEKWDDRRLKAPSKSLVYCFDQNSVYTSKTQEKYGTNIVLLVKTTCSKFDSMMKLCWGIIGTTLNHCFITIIIIQCGVDPTFGQN